MDANCLCYDIFKVVLAAVPSDTVQTCTGDLLSQTAAVTTCRIGRVPFEVVADSMLSLHLLMPGLVHWHIYFHADRRRGTSNCSRAIIHYSWGQPHDSSQLSYSLKQLVLKWQQQLPDPFLAIIGVSAPSKTLLMGTTNPCICNCGCDAESRHVVADLLDVTDHAAHICNAREYLQRSCTAQLQSPKTSPK